MTCLYWKEKVGRLIEDRYQIQNDSKKENTSELALKSVNTKGIIFIFLNVSSDGLTSKIYFINLCNHRFHLT